MKRLPIVVANLFLMRLPILCLLSGVTVSSSANAFGSDRKTTDATIIAVIVSITTDFVLFCKPSPNTPLIKSLKAVSH
jgi:hypothetical protein